MLVFSFGESFRSGTHKALIFTYLKHKEWDSLKTDYYGNTRACSQLGSALSATLAAFIVILNANIETIFLFSTIPYLFGLINLSLYPAYLDNINKNESFSKLWKKALQLSLESLKAFKQKQMILATFNLSFYSAYYKSVKDYFQVLILSFSAGIVFLPNFNTNQQNAIFIGIAYTLLFLLSSVASKKSQKFLSFFTSDKRALNYSIIVGVLVGVDAEVAAGVEFGDDGVGDGCSGLEVDGGGEWAGCSAGVDDCPAVGCCLGGGDVECDGVGAVGDSTASGDVEFGDGPGAKQTRTRE